jgi:hypothetical protein
MKTPIYLYVVSVIAILVESAWAAVMLNVLWLGIISIVMHFAR